MKTSPELIEKKGILSKGLREMAKRVESGEFDDDFDLATAILEAEFAEALDRVGMR